MALHGGDGISTGHQARTLKLPGASQPAEDCTGTDASAGHGLKGGSLGPSGRLGLWFEDSSPAWGQSRGRDGSRAAGAPPTRSPSCARMLLSGWGDGLAAFLRERPAVMPQCPPGPRPAVARGGGHRNFSTKEGYLLSPWAAGWCHRPTEFGSLWRQKEPNTQKPRLNKGCGGRAESWGPRGRTVQGERGRRLISYRRASVWPPGW